MATKEKQVGTEAVVETVAVEDAAVYHKAELMAAAKSAFGVNPEVVVGALKLAGKDSMTKTEAEKAIKTFLERTV